MELFLLKQQTSETDDKTFEIDFSLEKINEMIIIELNFILPFLRSEWPSTTWLNIDNVVFEFLSKQQNKIIL